MYKNVLSALFMIVMSALIGTETGYSANLYIDNNFPTVGKWSDGDKDAPDFTLYTISSEEIKLSDYAGKIVILDFWATWCPPCKKSIPDLISIQKEYQEEVVVIGISLDYPSVRNDLESFITEAEINYPVVIGTEKVVEEYGNIRAIPTTFIINSKGKIVNEFVGLIPKSSLIKEIDSILNRTSIN